MNGNLDAALSEQIRLWIVERDQTFKDIVDDLVSELKPLIFDEFKRRIVDQLHGPARFTRPGPIIPRHLAITASQLSIEAADLTNHYQQRDPRASPVELHRFVVKAQAFLSEICDIA